MTDTPEIEPLDGEALLKVSDVKRITTLSPATIYRKVKDGTFPRPRKAGENCSRWRRSDITAWIEQLPPA